MSEIKVDNLTGKTAAGNVTITSEGGAATQSLQQGVLKAWTALASSLNGTVGDSLNNSSFSDDGSGQTTITMTNPMINTTDFCVSQASTYLYPYQGKGESTTTYALDTVNSTGTFSDGTSNGMVSGDLA